MITIFSDFFFFFLKFLYSLLVLSSYLQEVPSTTSHHGSLFAFEAVDHHHQVHVGILLSDCAITPDALYFVVCILRRHTEEIHGKSAEPVGASLLVSHTANEEGNLLLNRQVTYKVTRAVLVGKLRPGVYSLPF